MSVQITQVGLFWSLIQNVWWEDRRREQKKKWKKRRWGWTELNGIEWVSLACIVVALHSISYERGMQCFRGATPKAPQPRRRRRLSRNQDVKIIKCSIVSKRKLYKTRQKSGLRESAIGHGVELKLKPNTLVIKLSSVFKVLSSYRVDIHVKKRTPTLSIIDCLRIPRRMIKMEWNNCYFRWKEKVAE